MNRPILTVIALVAALTVGLGTVAAQEGRVVSGDGRIAVVLKLFEEVVFGAEYAQTKPQTLVAKWQGPVRISVQGKSIKRHAKVLENHTRDLIRLTGLDINFVKPGKGGNNVFIMVVPGNQMDRVPIPGAPAELLKTLAAPRACYFISAKKPEDRIVAAYIVINADRTPDLISHCLIEETTQAFGFPNDTSLVKETTFNNAYNTLALHPVDKILVQTLYDPRMKPGLPKAEAISLARKIITEKLKR